MKCSNYGVLLLALAVAACGGGGSSNDDGSHNNNENAGLGENVLILPEVPGLEMVTHIEPFDLDGDGRMDLIMFLNPPHYAGGARIKAFMNRETGFEVDDSYFPESLFSDDQSWWEGATLVDINKDGFLDIVTRLDANGTPLAPLLWNDTEKRFEAMQGDVLQDSNWPGFVVLDVDGNGHLDLLSRRWGGAWYLLENDGEGNFTAHETPIFTPQSTAAMVTQPVVIDVDNDGRPDLVFGGPAWEHGWVDETVPLVVMLNTVSGWVQADNEAVFSGDEPAFTHLRLMRVADFNGDGCPDIVIANHGYDVLPMSGEYNGLLMNNCNGGFTVNTSSPGFNYKGFTHALAVGDLNNDGSLDIVFADITGEDAGYRMPARLLFNDGAGNFESRTVILSHEFAMTSGGGWTAAALLDVDGDGYLDLVLGSQGTGGPSLVFFNDGNGYFR